MGVGCLLKIQGKSRSPVKTVIQIMLPVKSYSQNKKNMNNGSILADFLCIIGQKLKWVAGLTGCPKNPEIFFCGY